MTFDTKVISKSAKAHQCSFCLRVMPKGSSYVSATHKGDDGSFEDLKMCLECAYIIRKADTQSFKPGNFSDVNIPNCLRKIRNDYRKDPIKAWDKEREQENDGFGKTSI